MNDSEAIPWIHLGIKKSRTDCQQVGARTDNIDKLVDQQLTTAITSQGDYIGERQCEINGVTNQGIGDCFTQAAVGIIASLCIDSIVIHIDMQSGCVVQVQCHSGNVGILMRIIDMEGKCVGCRFRAWVWDINQYLSPLHTDQIEFFILKILIFF